MAEDQSGKVPYPDETPEPSGWPDEEELPICDDIEGGQEPYPPEIKKTTQGHPEEPFMDEI